MYKSFGILWDLDGVIVDTGPFHYAIWKRILAEAGIELSEDTFRSTFGMNNFRTLSAFLERDPTPQEYAAISERKEKLFRESIQGKIQPLPGVLDWLERFRQWGFRQAIASSAPPENIDQVIDSLPIRPYFDAIVSGIAIAAKPDPAIFLQAAHQIEMDPADCLVLEDSIVGVKAAKAAGMKCLAVLTTHPAEALRVADVIVDQLDQISVLGMKQIVGIS